MERRRTDCTVAIISTNLTRLSSNRLPVTGPMPGDLGSMNGSDESHEQEIIVPEGEQGALPRKLSKDRG